MSAQEQLVSILEKAGVTVGGSAPWDVQVHDERLYDRVLAGGTLAVGESYMDGWWDAEDLTEMCTRVMRSSASAPLWGIGIFWYALRARLTNMQTRGRAKQVARAHYNMGNDLFATMLDKRMIYSCGYWRDAHTLDEAQEAKLDLICRKVGLKKGQHILDIGCGWGGFLKFAAERYGVTGVGVTISEEQVKLGRENVKGLPIDIQLKDYRDLSGTFDHIISIGMFEHVGPDNYRTYFKKIRELLKSDESLFLLHTIGGHESSKTGNPWIHKYIFPNGVIPSFAQVGMASDAVLACEDFHNFGVDYDKTLQEWYKNLVAHWDELKDAYGGMDESFFRMMRYYLLSCAATFRVRQCDLYQIVFSKHGVPGGYQSVR